MRLAYKLFRVKKDGAITSLFINKSVPLEQGKWLTAHCFPTKGFKVRPGWHCTHAPCAPHLSEKGRVWRKVAMLAWEVIDRPKKQGGRWYIARWIKII